MKKIILLSILFISSVNLWAQNSGFLDTTFSLGGTIRGRKQLDSLQGTLGAITVDGTGKIVAVSYKTNSIYVNRLNTDGSDDATFGNKGFKSIKMNSDTLIVLCANTQGDDKILIGGQRLNISKDMFLMRLNQDGSLDNTFDGDGYWIFDIGANEEADRIFVQNDNKIIVGGKKGGGIIVARLNPEGTFDSGFNSKGYLTTGIPIQSIGGLQTDINNSIYIAGDSASFFTILKLNPNGTSDLSFGQSGFARAGVYLGSPVGMGITDAGKIVVGGSFSAYSFSSLQFDEKGKTDNLFGANGNATYSCYYANMNSTFLNKEGGILMAGSYSYYGATLMSLYGNGKIDSTFGNNGIVNIPNTPTQSKTVLSGDDKYLLFSQESATFFIYKIFSKPVVHIVGSGFISPKSIETYKVGIPGLWGGATYKWTYSGKNVSLYPDVNKPNQLTILFSDSATEGILTCKVSSSAGIYYGRGDLSIMLNPKPTNANQLAKTTCVTNLNDCSLGYIDNFTLNTLNNINSGCSANGYSDYTQSDFTDTLAAGGVYSAKLKIPNDGTFTSYVGIWIDYNNDGNFSNIDEFVGEAYGTDSKVMVDIFLKNREGYDGPKRLRVRSRPDVKITSTDACPAGGEKGETEDYLILLQKQPSLEAPQIITPNEDGLNDYFVIHGVDPNKKNKLTIFDRIGEVKFQSSNYENNWNGTDKNGTKLSPGTYYYVFTNEKNSIKGFVEIRY